MRAKVYRLDARHMIPLLRGEVRILNLPAKCEYLGHAFCQDRAGKCVGVLIQSDTFDDVRSAIELPVVIAMVERVRPGSKVRLAVGAAA